MITIQSIVLHNWLRYRGRHHLVLKPTFYGVTAQWHMNPDRSNAGGKSGFIEAVRFALSGRHRKPTADEWITDGEGSGGVTIVLDDSGIDSVEIVRSRIRGKSTQLVVQHGKMEKKQQEAQDFIDQYIGLSPDDFESSSYLAQKWMSQFVTGMSGGNMEIVTGWLGLEPLEQASEMVGEDLSKLLREIAGIEQNKRACLDFAERIYEPFGWTGIQGLLSTEMPIVFDDMIKRLDQKIIDARSTEQLFLNQDQTEADAKSDFADAAEYHRIVKEGTALRKRIDSLVPMDEKEFAALEKKEATIHENVGVLRADMVTKRNLAKGDFDGVCPVGDCLCPIQDKLNENRPRARKLFQVAEEVLAKEQAALNTICARLRAEENLRVDFNSDSIKRQGLLKDAARLKPAADRVANHREPDDAVSTTCEDLEKARAARTALEEERAKFVGGKKLIEQQIALFEKADRDLEVLRARAELLREAHYIVGKQGAQRQICMNVFSQIERGANLALQRCDIDLKCKVSWERETGELAKTCIDCGTAFPKSRKEKVCSTCGAARGIHFERKFEVTPVPQSGGPDDLAGIAVQLAAADWLRRDRHSGWAVAFLDEPLAHLDRAHSLALASHLPGLLRHFGFEQGFILAHSARAMAAMPAMVEIHAGRDGSSFVGKESTNGVDAIGTGDAGRARRDARVSAGQPDSDGTDVPPPRRRARRSQAPDRHEGEARLRIAKDLRRGPDGPGNQDRGIAHLAGQGSRRTR